MRCFARHFFYGHIEQCQSMPAEVGPEKYRNMGKIVSGLWLWRERVPYRS